MTDSLAGPSDITMVQSALTTTQNDGRQTGTSPYVSQWQGDWYGNDRWGAGYYTYSYSGTSPDGWSYAQNYLSVDARANSQTAYGVLQANVAASGDWRNSTSNVGAYIYAMGWQVRNSSRGGAQFNRTTSLNSLPEWNLFKAYAEYSVYGITVYAEARIFATGGQTVAGRVWTDGINGTLDQYTGVYGEVTGGAKVLGGAVSGGVSLKDLSLTSLHFPLQSTAKWTAFSPAPGACVSIAYAGGRYSTSLQWLSGRVVLWASAAWGLWKDEYEIANWPPIYKNFDLMNYPVMSRQVGNSCFPAIGSPPVVN